MRTLYTPKNPVTQDWSSAYVVYRLREAGISLRKLSRLNHYGENSLKLALVRPWPKAEKIIADFIGVAPQEIWPSRYHEDGTPKSGRGERGLGRYKRKSSSAGNPRNVKEARAA